MFLQNFCLLENPNYWRTDVCQFAPAYDQIIVLSFHTYWKSKNGGQAALQKKKEEVKDRLESSF